MYSIRIIILLWLTADFCVGQNLSWAANFEGTFHIDRSIIQVDASGYVYVAGHFNGSLDLDQTATSYILTTKKLGGFDVFLAKYTKNGNLVWAKQIGGGENTVCTDFKLDKQCNLYITGCFGVKVDFDPGPDTAYHTSLHDRDIYFAKYDSTGAYKWSRSLQGEDNELTFGLALDNSGNIYLAGIFSVPTDFDPGPSSYTLSNLGTNAFMAKYDNNGSFIYVNPVLSKSFSEAYGFRVEVKPTGEVVFAGVFEKTIDIDPGSGTVALTSTGAADIFMAEYTPSGQLNWAKQLGGVNDEHLSSLRLDSVGNIYLSGLFMGTTDLDPGPDTATLKASGFQSDFVAKFDSKGNILFAKGFGATMGCCNDPRLALDSVSNIYVTGVFQGTEDFDPGPGIYTLTSKGGYDVFMLVLDFAGNFVSVHQLGSNSYDYAYGIATSREGIHLAGSFVGTVDFDFTSATMNLTAPSDNLYLAKYTYPLILTGLQAHENKPSISIHPNPSKGRFSVFLSSPLQNGRITVVNSFGQCILDKKNIHGQCEINLSDAATGVYSVTFTGEGWNQTLIKKVVVSGGE